MTSKGKHEKLSLLPPDLAGIEVGLDVMLFAKPDDFQRLGIVRVMHLTFKRAANAARFAL